MIETLPFPPLLCCAHCRAVLSEYPEKEFEDWIVRCLECGARNVIETAIFNSPLTDVEVVGWRE